MEVHDESFDRAELYFSNDDTSGLYVDFFLNRNILFMLCKGKL